MLTLRPAAYVMSPERAGAAFPTALSFARSFFRRMLRERWRMSVVRRVLDSEGRGDALYKLTGNGQDFHLLVVSTVFPQHQKVDRSFGINWDISAALCQGEWSREREERLKPEIPKQYLGRYDRETLCFTRGNRSERIFDEVVEALAGGRQPDPTTLASVGYIFRTTAFAGNGLFNMCPYDALPPDHPLREPYHLQMAAAFLLREFVSISSTIWLGRVARRGRSRPSHQALSRPRKFGRPGPDPVRRKPSSSRPPLVPDTGTGARRGHEPPFGRDHGRSQAAPRQGDPLLRGRPSRRQRHLHELRHVASELRTVRQRLASETAPAADHWRRVLDRPWPTRP